MGNVLNINIIGNGFDKMHGVDSTYYDFLNYLKDESELSETNYIYKEMVLKHLNDTWIDCESYLNELFGGFVKFKEKQLGVKISSEVDVYINYANSKYGAIKEYYSSYIELGRLINLTQNNVDTSMSKIIENDILKNIGSSETFLIEKMENDILNDYYELRNELIKYLKLKEQSFFVNPKFADFLEKNNFGENGICLNFNYTKTALNYFKNVHHIHGDLVNENIVWGYYNCAMENVCKSWQLLCLNAGNHFFEELSKILRPNVITVININIFGHSIGENDIGLYKQILTLIETRLNVMYNELYFGDDNELDMTINYTYYDDEKQLGKDQISKVKNIKHLGTAAEVIIANHKLNGYNTKYEF